jgi:anti-sigma-K factor RskA
MNPDREQLLAYALGQLSPAEAAQVQARIDADPALYADVQADQDALLALVETLDLSAAQVPPGAHERLLERLRVEEAPAPAAPVDRVVPRPTASAAPAARPARSLTALWAAVSLAAAVGVGLWLRPPADALARYAAVPGAESQVLGAAGAPLGNLVRLPDGRVYVRLTQAPAEGRTYQLWQIQGGAPVSLGVFGQEVFTASLPRGASVAVSVEPPGGSPQPTTTPLFVQAL